MQHQADRRMNNFKDARTLMSPFAQATDRTKAKEGCYLLQKEKTNLTREKAGSILPVVANQWRRCGLL
jgi:hypothetical protein